MILSTFNLKFINLIMALFNKLELFLLFITSLTNSVQILSTTLKKILEKFSKSSKFREYK